MSELTTNSIAVAGETLEIRPRGAFANTLTTAYAELMARIALEPLGDKVQKLLDENSSMTIAEAQEIAAKARSEEGASKMTEGVLAVVAGKNLLYQLSADALGKDLEWAERELDPGQVARIVKRAKEIGGIAEYLSESLSFLMTAGAGDEEGSIPSDTGVSSLDAQKDSSLDSTDSSSESMPD